MTRSGKTLRWLHRWAGLAMAGFLIVVGITGSLLAFYSELDRWIAPQLRVAIEPNRPRLDTGEIGQRALQLAPHAYITSVYLREPDQAEATLAPRINPATNSPFELDYDELLLNPYTGAELGRRTWGDITQGLHNLMPFIYRLHYELALGSVGVWTLGIIALIWTLDCFIGLIITLPPARRFSKANNHHQEIHYKSNRFWSHWAKAWKIKTRSGRWRFNYDLHRAASLWLWLLLLIFAWSSVYMNLWDTVYTQTTKALFEYHPPWSDLHDEKASEMPMRDWREVNAVAVALMAREAQAQGFTVITPRKLRYQADKGVYQYRVLSSLDMGTRGATDIYFDAQTNAIKLRYFPSKQHSGNTITNWLAALHMAQVFGLPYRIIVAILGLCVAMLSITGVLVWWRKRKMRFSQ